MTKAELVHELAQFDDSAEVVIEVTDRVPGFSGKYMTQQLEPNPHFRHDGKVQLNWPFRGKDIT